MVVLGVGCCVLQLSRKSTLCRLAVAYIHQCLFSQVVDGTSSRKHSKDVCALKTRKLQLKFETDTCRRVCDINDACCIFPTTHEYHQICKCCCCMPWMTYECGAWRVAEATTRQGYRESERQADQTIDQAIKRAGDQATGFRVNE